MVEDSVGYTNLELLLNAEMQRQSLVARKVFKMSRTQTGNRVKQIRGDGAYQRSQVFNDLIESVGVRPRYAVRNDPNKQALVEVSQKHIWAGARKLLKRSQLPYVYLGYALLNVGLRHNLSPPPGGTEPRLFTLFPYETEVDWLSILHTFGCLCHVVLDKKYHGLRKEEDRCLPAAWMGLRAYASLFGPSQHVFELLQCELRCTSGVFGGFFSSSAPLRGTGSLLPSLSNVMTVLSSSHLPTRLAAEPAVVPKPPSVQPQSKPVDIPRGRSVLWHVAAPVPVPRRPHHE
eukprot:g15088.t1